MARPDRPVALITGASAGIGAALARSAAARGWDLVLTARREAPMKALASELTAAHETRSSIIRCDLSAPDGAADLVGQIENLGLRIDGLINNAGFSRTQTFLRIPPEEHQAMLDVMLVGPIHLARALAPAMVERGFGRIINVASLAGLLPATGGDTLYGPIKSFLIKASAGLNLELRGTGVHVTALCPGYTWSEFHDVNGARETVSAAYPRWLWMTADRVAEIGWSAVEANRPRVVPGPINALIAGLAKLTPDGLALGLAADHARRLDRL